MDFGDYIECALSEIRDGKEEVSITSWHTDAI